MDTSADAGAYMAALSKILFQPVQPDYAEFLAHCGMTVDEISKKGSTW